LPAFFFVLLLGACAGEEPGDSGGARGAAPVLVETAVLARSPVEDTVDALGTLYGNESVTITAKVAEQVARVHFEDGELVEAGDVLVELDNSEQLAQRREAEANLREAELQLQRLSRLGSDISTVAQIDVAETRVKASRARLAAIEARIEDYLIRAPFDGALGFRRVSPGALVTPGTVIAELDDISRLKLDFTVPEVHLARVDIGDSLQGTSVAWPDRVFSGRVVSLGSRVDPITRTFTVRGLIDNMEGRLRPGMLINVRLVVEQRPALVLPEQALIQRGGHSSVYRLQDDGTVERVNVSIGKRVAGGIEILSGLEPGQRVVVNGLINLRPGVAVRDVAAQAEEEAAQ
jgi:membrane fusion protein (multidrug efflux system)